jgi:hypothetical protein
LGINPLISITGRSLFKRGYSKTLDKMGKPVDVNSLGGFLGFKMTICAILHCAGKYPLSKTALINWVRYFTPIIGNSLGILVS